MQRVPSHDANGSGARLAAVVNARRTWGLLMFPSRDREGVVPSAHHSLAPEAMHFISRSWIECRGGRYLSIPLAPALSARSVYSRQSVRAGPQLVLASLSVNEIPSCHEIRHLRFRLQSCRRRRYDMLKGWFVLLESILAVLAALRVFFSRRATPLSAFLFSHEAIPPCKSLLSASRSPCSDVSIRVLPSTLATDSSGPSSIACGPTGLRFS